MFSRWSTGPVHAQQGLPFGRINLWPLRHVCPRFGNNPRLSNQVLDIWLISEKRLFCITKTIWPPISCPKEVVHIRMMMEKTQILLELFFGSSGLLSAKPMMFFCRRIPATYNYTEP